MRVFRGLAVVLSVWFGTECHAWAINGPQTWQTPRVRTVAEGDVADLWKRLPGVIQRELGSRWEAWVRSGVGGFRVEGPEVRTDVVLLQKGERQWLMEITEVARNPATNTGQVN